MLFKVTGPEKLVLLPVAVDILIVRILSLNEARILSIDYTPNTHARTRGKELYP